MSDNKPAKVLPNRKVIVERNHEGFSEARDLLCQIAFLEEIHEHVMIYKLVQEGIWYGCWRGISAERMIQRLEVISETPIEEKLRKFIEEVVSKYGKLVALDHDSKKLRCTVRDPSFYSEFRNHSQSLKDLRRFFTPFKKRSYLIPAKHLTRIENATIRYLKVPIKDETSGQHYDHYRNYSPNYRKRIGKTDKSKIAIAQELQRLKVQDTNFSPSSFRENYYSLLTAHIYPTFGVYPDRGRVGESLKEALEFSGIRVDPLEERNDQKRKKIQQELTKLNEKGESLIVSNLEENHIGLLSRIKEYYSDFPGEGNNIEKAVKDADLTGAFEGRISRNKEHDKYRRKVANELDKLSQKGIPLLSWYVRKEDSGLYSRIKTYFRPLAKGDSPFVEALQFSDLYQGIEQKKVIAEKVVEGEITRRRLGHLKDDEATQKIIVKKELLRLKEEGGSLRSRHLSERHNALYRQIETYFPSKPGEAAPIYKALKFAGIDPSKVFSGENLFSLMGRAEKRDKVREELRELARERGSLDGLSTEFPALYQRIHDNFKDLPGEGGAFYKALKYADLDSRKLIKERVLWNKMSLEEQKEWIKEQLLYLKNKGKSLTGISSQYPDLYTKIYEVFKEDSGEGSSTDKALKYAGFDPETYEIIDDKTEDKP